MANPRQLRSLILSLSLGTATAALAIVFVLTVVATQSVQAQTFKVIHTFSGGVDGGRPAAGLTVRGGNLFGTTTVGGGGYGTVFTLKPTFSGWIFNTSYSFAAGSDGAYPQARVIFGPNGRAYGTTENGGNQGGDCNIGLAGCGTVFSLAPPVTFCRSILCPWTETVLYRFGYADGSNPFGELVFDQAGNIYGTTHGGGSYRRGVVFKLTPSGGGWTESVLYNFSGSDGENPFSGVTLDNAGKLYGTTESGGAYGRGTIFELTRSQNGWAETFLHSFQTGSDGSEPFAGLIFDPSGNLYGTTPVGGIGNGGTVFKLTRSGGSWTYSLVYSFTGHAIAPCGPTANVVMDGAGDLYGTTGCDGAYNAGTVFKLTPSGDSWTYTSLHDFTGGSDGVQPISNVVFDVSGNLYGTTLGGGSGYGVVWEITP